jgi:hypothetical protein
MGRILVLTAVLGGCALATTAAAAEQAPGGVGVMVSPQPYQGVQLYPGTQSLGPPYIYATPPIPEDAITYIPSHPGIRQWMANHRREPDGVPHPMGSGNAWTEFKFVFGSARQFYGTAEASDGVWCKTVNPAPWDRPRSDR